MREALIQLPDNMTNCNHMNNYNHMNKSSAYYSSEKYKSNQMQLHSYPSEWLKLKRCTIPSVGEDVIRTLTLLIGQKTIATTLKKMTLSIFSDPASLLIYPSETCLTTSTR